MGFREYIRNWWGDLDFNRARAADLINDGIAHYNRGDHDAAIACYTEAIRIKPSVAWYGYCNRGTAWYCKQEYDRAIADFSHAIEINSKSKHAYTARGCAWLAKLEFDRAIADFNSALDRDRGDAIAYVNRATAWHYKQEFGRALDDCDHAIRYDPNSAPAFCGRGCARLAKQQQDRSVNGAFQPDRPTPQIPVSNNAGLSYNKALDDFYEAIRLDPSYAWGFIGRGATWHFLEDYDKAVDDYTEAIRIDPSLVDAYVNRGQALGEKQAYRSAIADFEKAISLAPNNVLAINGLAWLLGSALDAELRDGMRAVELARKAFALDWTNPAAWLDTMAVAHAETGNFAEAIRCAEQALLTAPAAFEEEMRQRLALYRSNKPYRQQSKRLPVTQFMPANVRRIQ